MRIVAMYLIVAATSLVAACTTASDSTSNHSLRQERHAANSNFRYDEVRGLPVDPWKSWAELSESEKNVVRAQYEDMPAADEPPYPLEGHHRIYSEIADAAKVFPGHGALILVVEVNSEGKPLAVQVVETPNTRLAEYLSRFLMKETYKPAVCGGRPCRMQLPIRATLSF